MEQQPCLSTSPSLSSCSTQDGMKQDGIKQEGMKQEETEQQLHLSSPPSLR
jgi:hypothetical protein